MFNAGEVSAWMRLTSDTNIKYRSMPGCDEIELEIAGGGLDLVTDGEGLAHCIDRLNAALAAHRAGQECESGDTAGQR